MNGPRTVRVGEVDLPMLRLGDFIEFSDRVWHDMRARMLTDLDEAHVSDDARAKVIAEHSHRRGLPDLVMMWAWRLEGAKAIVERAAKNAGVSCPDLDALGPLKLVEAARALAFVEKEDPKAGAGQ